MKRRRVSRQYRLLKPVVLMSVLMTLALALSAVASEPTPELDTAVRGEGGEAPGWMQALGLLPAAPSADDGGAWEVGVHHSADPLEAHANAEGWGLYNRLAACGFSQRYNFGNASAWEEDFKRVAAGGKEHLYLDTVDLQFYVGHGSPSSFTFDNAAHDDAWLTPSDCNRAWGDGDNDWVALTSCQVLGDSNLSNWAGCFNGTHIILGFKTNAAAHINPVDTQGYQFANYLCGGYNVCAAWFKAADRSQPAGRVVRCLLNEVAYLNDRPKCGAATCPLAADSYDTDAWVATHTAGSEPARYVPIEALAGAMPVFKTQPFSLDDAARVYPALGNAFGVSVTVPGGMSPMAPQGDLWTTVMPDGRELEMDPGSGMYGYLDTANLWTSGQAYRALSSQDVMLTAADARSIADQFLRQNNLMAGDSHYYETVSDTLSGGPIAGANSAEMAKSLLADEQPLVWQVIYSRILTYTPQVGAHAERGAQQPTVEFSVIGPGAKQKVYVNTTGVSNSLMSPLQSPIVGAMGNWRGLLTTAGLQPIATVPILDPAQVITLHQQLEGRVVVNTPPIDADGRQVMSYTVAYWEEAAGVSQAELMPVYALVVSYTNGGLPVAVDNAYIPANSTYMRPFAQIESGPTSMVRVGQVVSFTATDASRTLANLGFDQGLNFAMSSSNPDDYLYEWYVSSEDPANKIGAGRTISYTVRGDTVEHEGTVQQTILLKVTNAFGANAPLSASDLATLDVQPRVFLPIVIKQ